MRVPAVKAAAVRGLAAPTNCRDGCTYLGRDRRHPFCCAAMAARKVAVAVIAELLPTLPRRVTKQKPRDTQRGFDEGRGAGGWGNGSPSLAIIPTPVIWSQKN